MLCSFFPTAPPGPLAVDFPHGASGAGMTMAQCGALCSPSPGQPSLIWTRGRVHWLVTMVTADIRNCVLLSNFWTQSRNHNPNEFSCHRMSQLRAKRLLQPSVVGGGWWAAAGTAVSPGRSHPACAPAAPAAGLRRAGAGAPLGVPPHSPARTARPRGCSRPRSHGREGGHQHGA